MNAPVDCGTGIDKTGATFLGPQLPSHYELTPPSFLLFEGLPERTVPAFPLTESGIQGGDREYAVSAIQGTKGNVRPTELEVQSSEL